MIYLSSSCVKAKYISEAVVQLASAGYRHIELSGGTQFRESLLEELQELKAKYQLSYLLHNYFPPPRIPFVVNLAAIDDETHQATFQHLKKSIEWSKILGSPFFGFHAGFLINIPINQMGREITEQKLYDRKDALDKFCSGYKELQAYSGNVKLYLENNVLSDTNYKNFNQTNPFFFTDKDGYYELEDKIAFEPLLDVGHLKVSCKTLGHDFKQQLAFFIHKTDYIHISDNNALSDENKALIKKSEMFDQLSRYSLKDKTITLEVYSGWDAIEESYLNMEELQK